LRQRTFEIGIFNSSAEGIVGDTRAFEAVIGAGKKLIESAALVSDLIARDRFEVKTHFQAGA